MDGFKEMMVNGFALGVLWREECLKDDTFLLIQLMVDKGEKWASIHKKFRLQFRSILVLKKMYFRERARRNTS